MMRFFLGNSTELGQAAQEYIRKLGQSYDAIGVVETKLREDNMAKAKHMLNHRGLKTAWVEAKETGEGDRHRSGGAMIGARHSTKASG